MYDESNQLPWRLHILLEEADRNGDANATISWLPDGDAFKVHNKVEFENVIMPMYFKSSKYKSFQRSLNLWGFQTLTRDPNKGAIFHPDFLRGKPDRCKLMKRVRVKKKSPKMSLKEFQAEMRVQTAVSSSSPRASDAKAITSTHQTSDFKVLQSKVLVQQDSGIRHQQGQKLCQMSVQKMTRLSNPTRPSSQSMCNIFLKSTPATEQSPSPSCSFEPIRHPLLLNPVAQTQAPAPPLFTGPWSEHTAMVADLDHLKNRIGWALLVTNTPLLPGTLSWDQIRPHPTRHE